MKFTVIAMGALMFALPATAQPVSNGAGHNFRADGAVPTGSADNKPTETGERRICRRVDMTGSRSSARRVCMTAAEWRTYDRSIIGR